MPNISESTLQRLRSFRLNGVIEALLQQETSPSTYNDLSFSERLGLLLDAEECKRNNTRVNRLIKRARVPANISLPDIDFSRPRGFSKQDVLSLCQGEWLSNGKPLIIMGKTGVGKSFIGGVITHELCRRSIPVHYLRTHEWLTDLNAALQKSRLSQTVANLRKVPLLVFDEWMRDVITPAQSRLLLDLIDDRYQTKSIMFISQFDVKDWHDRFEDPTIADAILDRIVHCAIRMELSGESVRKLAAKERPGNVASLR